MEDVKLSIDQYSINITKGIIMDTVRNADSGHTGGPLSSLDFTYILFKEFLKFDPDDSTWENRDRFVLSIGHESALLYAMLSLVGWLDIEELKNSIKNVRKQLSAKFQTKYNHSNGRL